MNEGSGPLPGGKDITVVQTRGKTKFVTPPTRTVDTNGYTLTTWHCKDAAGNIYGHDSRDAAIRHAKAFQGLEAFESRTVCTWIQKQDGAGEKAT